MPAITTIKLRRGTASAWTSANPVLAAGEMGIESDTSRSKFGDGATAWTSLAYSVGDSSGIGTIEWTSVTDKPTEFPPEAHTHAISDVTNLQTELDGKAASVHTHVMADITDLDFPPTTVLSDTEPASPVLGTRWINTTNFIEYIYYDSYWVEV
jgi:hypothetical protein